MHGVMRFGEASSCCLQAVTGPAVLAAPWQLPAQVGDLAQVLIVAFFGSWGAELCRPPAACTLRETQKRPRYAGPIHSRHARSRRASNQAVLYLPAYSTDESNLVACPDSLTNHAHSFHDRQAHLPSSHDVPWTCLLDIDLFLHH
ncbi:hypothetical protein IAQ61_009071 [Plenodomus lingam]|uniref:uncharacterized protein n=1 Tax=Leptosphaeria maculans TaxID=5022 RepID=UPI0033247C9E|nr:hypothetical protein IAQ61_009071 [Plenodomus lingam]